MIFFSSQGNVTLLLLKKTATKVRNKGSQCGFQTMFEAPHRILNIISILKNNFGESTYVSTKRSKSSDKCDLYLYNALFAVSTIKKLFSCCHN